MDTKPLTPAYQRAVVDRNLCSDEEPFRKAIANIDFTGLAVLDFGCGKGFLPRLLKATNADVVYAFEVFPDEIDDDIKAWAADPTAKPRLVLNPKEARLDPDAPEGDLTNYDYEKLLAGHKKFAIVSNPPYFLFNRILSLTGTYVIPEESYMKKMEEKFTGGLMLTSDARLGNHPGWIIVDTVAAKNFSPPPPSDQVLLRTGFEGRVLKPDTAQPIISVPQRYTAVNNRNPSADMSDYYPEMWAQLNALKKPKPV